MRVIFNRLLSLAIASIVLGLVPTAFADCVGTFQPIASSVSGNGEFSTMQFSPMNGNQIEIAGVMETIPAGVSVVSGGVQATYNNAYINKVAGQTLIPNETYFVYAFMESPTDMELDFSGNGHATDPATGQPVMDVAGTLDTSQTLIGMVHTDAAGKFLGNASNQDMIGWCATNRATVALVGYLNYPLGTSSASWVVPSGAPVVSWVQWGVNDQFQQAWNAPNIEIKGDLGNTNGGSAACEIGVSRDGSGTPEGLVGSGAIMFSQQALYMEAFDPSAGGSNEGYHTATVLMESPNGGNCHFGLGMIIVFPDQS